MSYFPTDIPFMSEEELIENGLKKPYKKPEIINSKDLVPVVRCRECKHCITSRQGKLYCIHGFEQTIICAFAAIDNPIFEREFDSFCSYGEQRKERKLMNYKAIGNNIGNWIARRGLTQRQLADRLSITEVSMSRYITGTRIPKATLLYRMSKALNCTMEDLCYGLEDE